MQNPRHSSPNWSHRSLIDIFEWSQWSMSTTRRSSSSPSSRYIWSYMAPNQNPVTNVPLPHAVHHVLFRPSRVALSDDRCKFHQRAVPDHLDALAQYELSDRHLPPRSNPMISHPQVSRVLSESILILTCTQSPSILTMPTRTRTPVGRPLACLQ